MNDEEMELKVKTLLKYDHVTGYFFWKVDRRGTAKAGTRAGRVNSKGYREISVLGKGTKLTGWLG